MRFRKTLIALGVTGTLLGVGWFSAPHLAREYIESQYPGVTIGSVKLTWDSAELRDVHVVKSYGVANLERVTVHKDGSVDAEGGQATVRLDLLPEGKSETPGEGRKITAKGLQVEVLAETSRATFKGASYEAGKVCWEGATAIVGKLKGYDPCTVLACGSNDLALGEAGPGCATREKIEVSRVETEINLKRDIPHFPAFGTVTLEGLTVWPKTNFVTVAKASYGPLEAVETSLAREGSTTRLILAKLVLSHPWLGKGPLTFIGGTMVEKTDGESLVRVTHHGVPVRIDPEALTVRAEAKCADWAAAMPNELLAPLRDIQWDEGTLSLDIDVRAPRVKIKHTCKASCKTPLLAALRKPFKYLAYSSKDERFERETGPGTRDWTCVQDVGRDMPTAVIAMEDPGFPSHRGYISQAFENSLKDNLATGKFLRGGSTITMQLAKNLWLYRDKTVTRKLQEVLLAIALENCYSKAEILELYLNVVEFGPDLYGIGPASRHYFKTSPVEITAEQSFSLAMLLPRPRKGLPDKVRVRKLMETLARLKVIPESMLESEEPVDFSEWQ